MRKTIFLLAFLACLPFVNACDDGPAEKAGEEVDEAFDSAQRGLEDAGESIDDAVDEAKDNN